MPEAYPDLSRIEDRVIAETLRLVWDRIHAAEGRTGDPITLRAPLDANGNRLSSVADPEDDQDAVTLSYADSNYGAEAVANEIIDGGSFSIDVENLPGVLAEPQRMGVQIIPDSDSLPTTAGSGEVVTWQGTLYYFDVSTPPGRWVPLSAAAAILTGTHQERLDDFPASDQPLNLNFWETDWHILYRVIIDPDPLSSAQIWQVMESMGVMRDTISERPASASLDLDTGTGYIGMWFRASDQGNQAWRFQKPAGLAGRWVLVPDYGEAMDGTLSPDQKPSLGTHDSGFRFFSTDFAREYVWSGAAWSDAPSAPRRYEISFFDSAPEPVTGWVLCNGAASTRSTSVGGTAAYNVPAMTGAARYLESALASGGVGGSQTHTHTVSGDTGAPSSTTEVEAGTGEDVASSSHTHGSGTLGADAADGRPPYYQAIPYIRL